MRVPPGPVQRSERGLSPAAERNEFLTPAAEKALSAGRPAAPTLPDRPSKPQSKTGATGGRAVSARCWTLRLHNVYRYKLLIRGGASFREGRGRPPRALLAERPQPLIWTFPQEKHRAGRRESPGARGAGLGPAESSVAHRAPGARALRAREKRAYGFRQPARSRAHAAPMRGRRAAAPVTTVRTDELPAAPRPPPRPAPRGILFAGILRIEEGSIYGTPPPPGEGAGWPR